MPIKSPNFAVQQLSPSSLLAGRQQQEDNSIDSIVNQFITFGLRERLNERSLEAYAERQREGQEAASERTFMQDVNEGVVTPVPPGGFGLETPDGNALDIPTFRGPPGSRFEGRQYASTKDVMNAQRQVAMAQPAGDGYFEGTTQGDLVSPTGGSISEGQRQDLRVGDRERVIKRYEEFADEVASVSPNLAEAVRGEIEAVRNDPRFTEAEEQDFLNRATLSGLADMNTLARNIAEMNAERREEINGYVEHASRNLGMPTGDGRTTRPLRPDERYAYSLWRSGNLNLAENPEQLQRTLEEDILPNLRALPTAPAIQEQLTNWYNNSGRAEEDAHLDFVDWIQGQVQNPDESIRNEELHQEIMASVGGEFTGPNISEWATRPESARFRAAYALFNNGTTSKERIYELARTGLSFPHGLEGERGINSAFRLIYGDEWDTFESPAGGAPPQGGVSGRRGGTSGTDSGESNVDFSNARQVLSGTFEQMVQNGGADARRTLATIAGNVSGSREDLVRSLRETASTYQENAQSDNTSEENAEIYRQYADLFSGLANQADRGYQQYKTVLDSVFFPALQQSGAVEGMLDLSSYVD